MIKNSLKINLDRLMWSLAELEGILSGIAADGIVVEEEVRYLEFWLELHEDYHGYFPFSLFFTLIKKVLEDGIVTRVELEEILSLIQSWQSNNSPLPPQQQWQETMLFITEIPVDTPLDYTQQMWFKKIIPLLYKVPEESTLNILQLLSRILNDYIITPEERIELIAQWAALGKAKGWDRDIVGENQ